MSQGHCDAALQVGGIACSGLGYLPLLTHSAVCWKGSSAQVCVCCARWSRPRCAPPHSLSLRKRKFVALVYLLDTLVRRPEEDLRNDAWQRRALDIFRTLLCGKRGFRIVRLLVHTPVGGTIRLRIYSRHSSGLLVESTTIASLAGRHGHSFHLLKSP